MAIKIIKKQKACVAASLFCLSILASPLCNADVTATNMTPATYPLIIDHDGGVDDVISTTLQLLNDPERIKAITVTPADCYNTPAVWVMTQLKKLFLPAHLTIPLGTSMDEGTNPFPSVWRNDAWKLAHMSVWNEKIDDTFSLKNIPSALDVLTKALRESDRPVDILETGPCTNIADLLQSQPELKNKIHRLYVMGGALYVTGNVEEKGHDGSAEWNIYNNPQAFQQVLRSGIPMTLVSLDATQYTPIRKTFMAQLEQRLDIKPVALVHESLKQIQVLIDMGIYLFWDTLTSTVAINPDIVKTKKIKINVETEGSSMGKTFEDPHGFEVDVALWADQELFEKTVLNILFATKNNAL